MYNGFINLYKTAEISSNRALSILKRTLKQNNIVTKVGHFGTLDPIAEGVLPVALGRATRLFDYSLDKVKKYRARFRFGIETDTLDRTGQVLSYGKEDLADEDIFAVIPSLVGRVDQIPPQYSAKTIGGVRAYKLARKGQDFSLPAKTVDIYSIDYLGKTKENGYIEYVFDITCGGGTYIRSIVRDMATALGTVGIMTALTRTESGIFTIENAVTFEKLEKSLEDCIIPMERFLEKYPKITLTVEQFTLLKNGVPIHFCDIKAIEDDRYYVVYQPDDTLMGVGQRIDETFILKTWLL